MGIGRIKMGTVKGGSAPAVKCHGPPAQNVLYLVVQRRIQITII